MRRKKFADLQAGLQAGAQDPDIPPISRVGFEFIQAYRPVLTRLLRDDALEREDIAHGVAKATGILLSELVVNTALQEHREEALALLLTEVAELARLAIRGANAENMASVEMGEED